MLRDEPGLEGARSQEACPVCGEHTLSLLGYPYVSTMGVQPMAEILGMGEPTLDEPPGIACLSCGAQWHDIDAFRQQAGKPAS